MTTEELERNRKQADVTIFEPGASTSGGRRTAAPRPHGARRRERGATLVEFALVMPVFVALLLGTITGGMSLSRQNSVENAVREGTRFGAVNPVGDPPAPFTYLGQVVSTAKAAATGDLDDGTEGKQLCAALVRDGKSWKLTEDRFGTRSQTSAPDLGAVCFADGRLPSEARVQVTATRTSPIRAVVYNADATLASQSVTRYER